MYGWRKAICFALRALQFFEAPDVNFVVENGLFV